MNANPELGDHQNFAACLSNHIRQHQGWAELETFGESLNVHALDQRELRVFLASTGQFFREIPGGILSLALRVTDDRIQQDRFGAVESAASILLSAVDEYGLGTNSTGNTRNHHRLFADMVRRFGVCEADLHDPQFILPEAIELAHVTRGLYRAGSVAGSVGFHYASEVTSDREFELCYLGLAGHLREYTDIAPPVMPQKFLDFYFVHTVVEREHGAAGATAVDLYSASEIDRQSMLEGAAQFLDAYGALWSALNRRRKD